eukprot:CAMPEP_0183608026 /NCGR_PEP_ID=MMETSP0371-20130417/183754_1 /TAXON_ID=268820 /ORGANISM="Peridinium aciculiferum, Strain PAER-2" /LENGTH=315 /DNA_ID=CAMNT_0025820151 /DNA_START=74 /DNA_END=1021 /DNA_ORIENTATION=-
MAVRNLKAVALAACALAVAGKVQLRHSSHKAADSSLHVGSFVTPLEFKHQLRVCNAFANSAKMDVFRGAESLTAETSMPYKSCRDFDAPLKSGDKLEFRDVFRGAESLTAETSMPYKSCRDFDAPLKSGDKLEFRLGDASSGTFSVADLPNNDAVLLLVIHRHDSVSAAVSFESHVFAALESAQVAVIDTYRGKDRAVAKIMDKSALAQKDQKAAPVRSEQLRYDSVVAVNPGEYEVQLDAADGKQESRASLVALKHESYVVLRVGVEGEHGEQFPSELVVFPNPDPAALHSAAAQPFASLASVSLAAFAALWAC